MNSQGKTIRVYLVDGTALGVMAAEIINWTGKILTFPKGLLADVLKRPELAKTGIYFLVGPTPDQSGHKLVYVGKSDNIGVRLKNHDDDPDKEFCEQIAVFISKDENLTIGHASYLEARLINIIKAVGLAKLQNGNKGSLVSLPESEVSDMEYVISQLRVLMPVLGFSFMQELPLPKQADQSSVGTKNSSVVFELSYLSGAIHAEAYEAEGRLVVRAGSTIRHPETATPTKVSNLGYQRQIRDLLEQNKLIAVAGTPSILELTDDVAFASPSAASDLVCGGSTNGKLLWKIKGTEQTYGEWRAMQLDAATRITNK